MDEERNDFVCEPPWQWIGKREESNRIRKKNIWNNTHIHGMLTTMMMKKNDDGNGNSSALFWGIPFFLPILVSSLFSFLVAEIIIIVIQLLNVVFFLFLFFVFSFIFCMFVGMSFALKKAWRNGFYSLAHHSQRQKWHKRTNTHTHTQRNCIYFSSLSIFPFFFLFRMHI